MTQTLTAQNVFRSAYENRYTWNHDFPGYEATVTMDSDNKQHIAQIKVTSDLSFKVSDIEDEAAKKSDSGTTLGNDNSQSPTQF